MHSEDSPQEKRAWRAPEIVDVGGVLELTEGQSENVREPGSNPMTYSLNRKPAEDEVDLEGR
jgi:hypothetical protein